MRRLRIDELFLISWYFYQTLFSVFFLSVLFYYSKLLNKKAETLTFLTSFLHSFLNRVTREFRSINQLYES